MNLNIWISILIEIYGKLCASKIGKSNAVYKMWQVKVEQMNKERKKKEHKTKNAGLHWRSNVKLRSVWKAWGGEPWHCHLIWKCQ